MNHNNSHYQQTYYSWQKKSGELAALIDLWKFEPHIKSSHTVLDFGCGGGYILEKLHCKKKVGIEINQSAISEAKKRGLTVYRSLSELKTSTQFDVIIAHHSLEHVANPTQVLTSFKKHLKKNGIVICITPIDEWKRQKTFIKPDINNHLFTWTPQNIGNLFVHCGYTIQSIRILTHAWVPFSKYYYSLIPKPVYFLLSYLWCIVVSARQIQVIATIKSP